ncbi:FMRFamide receptor [Biomphalaria glabrata]|nr:FMRFamide receptor-like [Biomphalaria glabrata]
MSNSSNEEYPVAMAHIHPTLLEFFMTVNLVVLAEMIGYGGIVANIINILNFKKQGLQDSVNVTLTALAVSDFGALFCQSLINLLFSPFWKNVELPFYSSSIFAMLFFYPHGYFIRVSGFITAFAAFERCLCVVFPLKVKSIITKDVAVAVNVLIFIILLLYLFPEYYVSYPDWIYIPAFNRSVLTIFYRDNAEYILTVTNIVNDLFVPYITFFVLIICTAVIVYKLKAKAKWRRSISGGMKSSGLSKVELSSKDKKAVVMLTVVSVIFIICLTPQCVLMTVIGVKQELKVEGPLWDVSLLIYSFTSLLETVNCSVTIIVYYNMSTKYRETIQAWFPICLTLKKYLV